MDLETNPTNGKKSIKCTNKENSCRYNVCQCDKMLAEKLAEFEPQWDSTLHSVKVLLIPYWPYAFLVILNFYFRAILTELRHVSKGPRDQNLKSAVGIPQHSHSTNQEMKTSAARDRLLSQWGNVIKTVISMWDRKNCIFVSFFNKLIFYT